MDLSSTPYITAERVHKLLTTKCLNTLLWAENCTKILSGLIGRYPELWAVCGYFQAKDFAQIMSSLCECFEAQISAQIQTCQVWVIWSTKLCPNYEQFVWMVWSTKLCPNPDLSGVSDLSTLPFPPAQNSAQIMSSLFDWFETQNSAQTHTFQVWVICSTKLCSNYEQFVWMIWSTKLCPNSDLSGMSDLKHKTLPKLWTVCWNGLKHQTLPKFRPFSYGWSSKHIAIPPPSCTNKLLEKDLGRVF
jgi:hypothetical protein